MKNWILRTFFKSTLEELDRCHVQLAGCLTAAEGATANPARPSDWGWSLPYQKTLELQKEAERMRENYRAQQEQLKARDAQLEVCNLQVSALRTQRNVAWPRPAKRIPRAQILAAFSAPIDTGAGAALHQELDDYLQDLLDQVSQPPSPTMPESTRLHLAGGIEHVRLLQKHLLDLHAEASRKDAELEEKGE